MVEHLGDFVVDAVSATAEVLIDVEPRRRRWKIARAIALILIFSVPIAIIVYALS